MIRIIFIAYVPFDGTLYKVPLNHSTSHGLAVCRSYDVRPTVSALCTVGNASRLALSLPVLSLSSVGSVDTSADTISASWSGVGVIGTPSLPRGRGLVVRQAFAYVVP